MKVSKLFHWLYASVMFIPLLIAPIFGLAVRSDNNFQPIEVQAQDYEVVDFNQQYKPNNPNRAMSYTITDDYIINIQGTATGSYLIINSDPLVTTIENHKYLIKLNVLNNPNNLYFKFDDFNDSALWVDTTNTERIGIPYNPGAHYWGIEGLEVDTDYSNISFVINLFDLTQMFGSGNEPTIEQFNTWYPHEYYDYTLSKKELLNVGTTTLSDTDVGSQMVYTLYNATDKYFNFNQFLGIGNLFDWFQLNVFNGTAPLGFIIFWNLLIYWLLVSIAWLIFDIAMYVPKLAHRWLDKASLE